MKKQERWIAFRETHDRESFKAWCTENMDLLKKLIFPTVVIFAVCIFWIFGGAGDGNVKDDGLTKEIGKVTEEGQTAKNEDSTEKAESATMLYVDIGGEVNVPGVYEVEEGTRLFQVIEMAGGLTAEADTARLNQAEAVVDGQKITICNIEDAEAVDAADGSNQGGKQAITETEDGIMVNINLADVTQLQMVSGIGPVTAQKIVDYREANGPFTQKEELKNISGIGEKTYEALQDFITI